MFAVFRMQYEMYANALMHSLRVCIVAVYTATVLCVLQTDANIGSANVTDLFAVLFQGSGMTSTDPSASVKPISENLLEVNKIFLYVSYEVFVIFYSVFFF